MVGFIPYSKEVYSFVKNDGDEEFWDLCTFKAVPMKWSKGMPLYTVKIFIEQSLYDLEYRIKRRVCTCKGYICKGGCKHITEAEKQLNRFMDISYDKVPVS
jgi:hypothetical protein